MRYTSIQIPSDLLLNFLESIKVKSFTFDQRRVSLGSDVLETDIAISLSSVNLLRERIQRCGAIPRVPCITSATKRGFDAS
jgi:hypothetical protein